MRLLARVAVQTGIAPSELAELDGELWRELVRAVDQRWTIIEELLAFQAELAHEQLRVMLARSGTTPPKPIHVPRPLDAAPAERRFASPREMIAFANLLGEGRVVPRG